MMSRLVMGVAAILSPEGESSIAGLDVSEAASTIERHRWEAGPWPRGCSLVVRCCCRKGVVPIAP